MSDCKWCGDDCCGPCYDFCSCRHCWNGWKQVSFWTRLRWRIDYIWYHTFESVPVFKQRGHYGWRSQ